MKILLLGITHPTIKLLSKKLCANNSVKFLHYRKIDIDIPEAKNNETFDLVISLCPIWEVKSMLVKNSITFLKIIILSSTSIFSKSNSRSYKDRDLSKRYIKGENDIIKLCEINNAHYLICRTTMLWGFNYDKNISKIIRFGRKYHLLPYPYPSKGLRAPIHFQSLMEFLFAMVSKNISEKSEIIIISGKEIYKLNHIIKLIAQKYRCIKIPIFIPINFLININKITKLEIFNSIAGFAERSSNDLDFHNEKNFKTVFIEQKKLKEVI